MAAWTSEKNKENTIAIILLISKSGYLSYSSSLGWTASGPSLMELTDRIVSSLSIHISGNSNLTIYFACRSVIYLGVPN
jgi:hypothetical protein